MSSAQSNKAIGTFRDGMGVRAIGLHFRVSASTISRLRDRFEHTGSVKDRPRSDRRRKTTGVENRYIRVTPSRNRFMSAPKLAYHLYATSHDTSNHPKPSPFMWYIRPKTVRRYNVNSTTRTRKIELG